MKNFIKTIVLITTSVLLSIAGSGAYTAYATLRVVQTPTVRLYASESTSATSVRITPYPTDLDGNKLTITDFGDTPTFTVDPKISNYEEIESFTGITDNGDGTATLTGLSRDLTSKYPYTTAGTGKQHSAGAVVVFSNNPQIYGRLAMKENNETITGQWTFNTFPITPSNATSSYATAGVSQLATPSEQAAGTATSSTGNSAPLVLASKNATSTWNSASLAANKTVVTGGSGKIDVNFISTSTLLVNVGGSNGNYGNYSYSNLSPANSTGSASTTVFTQTIAANALGSSNYVHTRLYVNGMKATPGSCNINLEVGYGGATTTIIHDNTSQNFFGGMPGRGFLDIILSANNSTSSQRLITTFSMAATTTGTGFGAATTTTQFLNTAVDSTKAQGLTVISFGGGSAACWEDNNSVFSELYN